MNPQGLALRPQFHCSASCYVQMYIQVQIGVHMYLLHGRKRMLNHRDAGECVERYEIRGMSKRGTRPLVNDSAYVLLRSQCKEQGSPSSPYGRKAGPNRAQASLELRPPNAPTPFSKDPSPSSSSSFAYQRVRDSHPSIYSYYSRLFLHTT